MRYKPQHKEQTRRKIVEAASREFRTHGFEGVGVAKLMGTLGLTHGGFYAHFADKEDLVAEALALALGERLQTMLALLKAGGFSAFLDFYLSEDHRDHPALGCPLPALAAEVARRPPPSREAFTGKLAETFDAIAEHMPGATHSQRRAKVSALFASLVGAMSLARAVSDPVLSRTILASTREYLLALVGQEPGQPR